MDVTHRVVLKMAEVIASTLEDAEINTSYAERVNAKFRASICPLVRRGRAIARGEGVLTEWDVCTASAGSTAVPGSRPSRGPLEWRPGAPAMAAGLTDHTGRCTSCWASRSRCRPGHPQAARATAHADQVPQPVAA